MLTRRRDSDSDDEGQQQRGPWSALGLTAGNVITILVALGSVLGAYVADQRVIATLQAELAFVREETRGNMARIATLELRQDETNRRQDERAEEGNRRFEAKLDDLRAMLMRHDGGDARALRGGTRPP